jgi:hypothetical protein
MKLSKENLQFIDNYLKFNEVVYFDIRLEMLDHVATAVEQKMNEEQLEFYDAFKEYMVQNKKEVMKFNKGTGFYFQPIKKFGLFLFKPLSLVLGALALLFSKFLVLYLGINNISLYIVIIFAVFFYSFFIANYYVCNRRRFFFLEQNGTILFLLLQFGQFFNRSANQSTETSIFINTILLYLFLSFVYFYYDEMVIFKAKNKYLFS